jgi:hypothetical protein
MELDELQTLWNELSSDMKNQKKLTDKMILHMIQVNYRRKIKKIWVPEILGALVCFAAALFILINVQRLDSSWLFGSGIISAFILFLLPVLSLSSVQRLQSVNISRISYKESLEQFTGRKKEFVFIQKLGYLLAALLLVPILPVMVKLFSGKNPFTGSGLWIWYPFGFIFFYFCSKHVYRIYTKSAREAEVFLKELEN